MSTTAVSLLAEKYKHIPPKKLRVYVAQISPERLLVFLDQLNHGMRPCQRCLKKAPHSQLRFRCNCYQCDSRTAHYGKPCPKIPLVPVGFVQDRVPSPPSTSSTASRAESSDADAYSPSEDAENESSPSPTPKAKRKTTSRRSSRTVPEPKVHSVMVFRSSPQLQAQSTHVEPIPNGASHPDSQLDPRPRRAPAPLWSLSLVKKRRFQAEPPHTAPAGSESEHQNPNEMPLGRPNRVFSVKPLGKRRRHQETRQMRLSSDSANVAQGRRLYRSASARRAEDPVWGRC